MLINYKKIGDTLTDSELNAYASLLAHNKILKDSFRLKNGNIAGNYGEYTFDLSNASIVDNGILITDETLSNNITVKLSNPTQYATYTLHFNVVRYGDASILDEPTDNIETFDLTVDLIADTNVNIPLESLQEYDVILFDSNITIQHNKPEIAGEYVTDINVTSSKDIIQTGETLDLFAEVLSNLGNGVKDRVVYFFEKYVPTSLRLWSNKSIFEIGDSVSLTSKLVDEDGSAIEGEEVVFTQKDKVLFRDGGVTGDKNPNWVEGSSLSVSVDVNYTELKASSSNSGTGRYRSLNTYDGDFELIIKAQNGGYMSNVGCYVGVLQSKSQCLLRIISTAWKYYKITRINGDLFAYVKTNLSDDWESVEFINSSTTHITGEIYIQLSIYNQTGIEQIFRYSDLIVKTDVSLGSDVTDSNGIASVDYTPVGQGVMNVFADGDDCTDNINITDCYKYDKATTTDHNDIWTGISNTDLTRGTEYTTIKEKTVGTTATITFTNISLTNYRVEVDVFQVDGTKDEWCVTVLDENYQPIISGDTKLNEWEHISLDVTNVSANSRVKINTGGTMTELRFKNFKMYPI